MAQTIEQLQARLVKVQEAIDAALTGKRYRIQSGESSRELERQSLADLQRLEQSLLVQISRMDPNGGGSIRHGMPV